MGPIRTLQSASENGARRRGRTQVTDLYIRGPKLAAAEPRRVVVEMDPGEYQARWKLPAAGAALPRLSSCGSSRCGWRELTLRPP